MTPVLTVHVRRFAYDDAGPAAVRDVRLALGPGSLIAVLGASGSGKSTLAKVIAGWALHGGHARFDGTLELAPGPQGTGGRLEFAGGRDDPRLRLGAWGERVAYVPQRAADLLTGAAASVGEELAFSLEQRGVERGEMRDRVRRAAHAVGIEELLGRHPGRLSGGEQRRLALGCALVERPDVVVLDEPSASLDTAGAEALAEIVAGLRAGGAAVVVTAAAVDGLVRQADRCLLLDGGTVAAEGTPDDVLASAAFADSGAAGHGEVTGGPAAGSEAPAAGAPLAALEDVTFAYTARGSGLAPRAVLDGASLEARAGQVVALTGPNGAGKSTALRHFAGLARPSSGTVRIGGADIAGVPAGRVAATVGTLFQEPRDQLFERTALREVSFGLRALSLSRDTARARAVEALDAVGLVQKADVHPYELSASEQRLLALATVLARRPRVLLLDEPTVGLDRFGLEKLESAVRSAARAGAAVVLSTHALAWARGISHRVFALDAGRFATA
ncbi:ATP-binding cassette domain-containing protein [Sinomonas sp. JGH33]|uniref:ATP-binding cassette domain-containing protein n=1 Tax=Sinomonas terricola TaxID=3110330 RepID=A0ABU5T3Q0_9MICC|nr:ATP-binding cassette domain-containing protein [Sinomonas sp. JGH33]MEA5454292.1 ATP-binding cassette domain-containing protein [Sinomonas sp. JGH33]